MFISTLLTTAYLAFTLVAADSSSSSSLTTTLTSTASSTSSSTSASASNAYTMVPVTGTLGNASVVENNPPRMVYMATFPDTSFSNPKDPRGNIKGSIAAVAANSGIGVEFQIKLENLPTSGGPFIYHIHAAPVPSNGNCTQTLAHQDPYIRGETPACNSTLPQTCQVGDLSGKHGPITSDPFTATYHDDFASTLPGLGSFFGNRSVVVHFANKTRITCANFTLVSDGKGGYGNVTATSTGTAPVTQTSPPLVFNGGAGVMGVPGWAVVGLGVVGALML